MCCLTVFRPCRALPRPLGVARVGRTARYLETRRPTCRLVAAADKARGGTQSARSRSWCQDEPECPIDVPMHSTTTAAGATNNALPATPWSARAAQQVAHELYQRVWSQGEFWVLDLLLTDDHSYVDSCWGAEFELRGRRRYENLISDMRSAYPDLNFKIKNINGKEVGIVYVYWTASGTNVHGFLGLPATGQRVEFSGVTVLKVHPGTGKVWESRVFRDCPIDEMAAKHGHGDL